MDEEQPSHLMWDAEMPLLNNRFFLYDMAKLLLWTGLIAGLIFGGIALATGGAKSLGPLMALLGIILFGFLFLFVLISLLFLGNGYRVRYLMAAQGIGWESLGRRGRAASRLAVVAGALAGNPSVAGAGLLAAASESGLLAWKNVRTIKAYPAIGVISIMNSWRVVIRIYCTPQYYAYAIQWLRWGAAHARYQEIGAPASASAGQDSAGSFGLELIRRLALVAGACMCLWLAFWTPPVLVKVARADFAKEYERKYGERKGPVMGVMGLGREFIRQNTNPGSVEAYARRTSENYLLKASGQKWVDLYGSVENQPVFLHPGDPPIAELMPQVEDVYRRSTRLSSYLAVPSEGALAFLEVEYVNRPRESKADSSLIYPKRSLSWIWLAGGILVYFMIPWPKPSAPSLTNDRTSITIVDALGTVFAAVFFGIPLYAVNFTEEVLGSEIGIAVFCWCVGLSGIGILIWSSRLATRRPAPAEGVPGRPAG
jgi:hypothetical protein